MAVPVTGPSTFDIQENTMSLPRFAAQLAALATAALVLSACSSTSDSSGDTIAVGSANFTESEILANIYAEVLRDAGFQVEEKFNIGSREVYIPALEDSSIDVIPDYTGNLLSYLDSTTAAAAPADINAALPGALEARGLAIAQPANAEDKDSLVVTAATAADWGLTAIGDLAAYNAELIIAGTPEFQERAVGLPGLETNYGVIPADYVAISDGGGPATVAALVDGTVTAANIYTTSPDIPANNFVVLEDPANNFPAQNVVPVYRADALDATAVAALDSVATVLTTADLLDLNALVSGETKMEPAAAAKQWLEDKGLIGD
jgi:osmoprotectant transport system substrate-binding protein